MKKQYGLKTNLIYSISYEIFRIIIPLITTPYVSRILGSEGVGTYTLAHTYAEYFVLFAGFGFCTYASRELAYIRDDDDDRFRSIFWEIFLARGILLSLATIIYFLYFFIINVSKDISYRLCLIYLIASLFDVSYYYRATENFKTITLRNIFIKTLSLVLVLVKRSTDVWLYTLILAASEAFGQVIMIGSLDKNLFKKTSIQIKDLKRHFIVSFTLFIPTIAIQVYTMLDKVMLGVISTESQVGYYENAQKIPRLSASVASAIVGVATPRMAYIYAKNDHKTLTDYFNRIFSFVSFLVFPMCFGLIGISESFSSWFFGANFKGIDELVRIGAVLIISLGWSSVFGNLILIATGNQKYYTIAVYISALINILMNAILISRWGAKGALLASVMSEIIGMIIMFISSNRLFKLGDVLKSIPKYFFASISMIFPIKIIERIIGLNMVSTVIQLIVAGGTYVVVMIIIKDVNMKTCLQYFKNIIGRKF